MLCLNKIQDALTTLTHSQEKLPSIKELLSQQGYSGIQKGEEFLDLREKVTITPKDAIKRLENIAPAPLPQKININDFLTKFNHFKNKENLIKHLTQKADSKERLAYLSLVEPTFRQPDIMYQKGSRETYIKAFKDEGKFFYFVVTQDNNEKIITAFKTSRKAFIEKKLHNAHPILAFVGRNSKNETLQGLQGDILPKNALENQNLSKQALEELETSPFGTNYPEFYHKGAAAVKHLLETKSGQVQGAFYREDLGDISLVWGEAREGKKGYGLAHIIDKHPEITPEVLNEIITKGETKTRLNEAVQIHYGNKKVVLKSNWEGKPTFNKWIVTAYNDEKGLSISSKPLTEADNLTSNSNINSTTKSIIPQDLSHSTDALSFTLSNGKKVLIQRDESGIYTIQSNALPPVRSYDEAKIQESLNHFAQSELEERVLKTLQAKAPAQNQSLTQSPTPRANTLSPSRKSPLVVSQSSDEIIAKAQKDAQEEAEYLARNAKAKAQKQAHQAQKDAMLGKGVDELSLSKGQSIPSERIRDTKIILKDDTPPFEASFAIVHYKDIKPNFDRSDTQGRVLKQDALIENIIKDFKPELLFFREGGADGLPIITSDGKVISGNHRSQAIEQILSNPTYSIQARAYKEAAKDFLGAELKEGEAVVRMIKENVSDENILKLAFASNIGRESTIGEKALSNLSLYKERIKTLPSHIQSQDIEELKTFVSKHIDAQNKGLDTFNANLALLSNLAKNTKNTDIITALDSIKGDAQMRIKIINMFVDNAGEFHNLTHSTNLKGLEIRDFLSDAIGFVARASESRATDFAYLNNEIQGFLNLTKEGKASALALDEYKTHNLAAQALGLALAKFSRQENPSIALYEVLKVAPEELEKLTQPTLFSEGKALYEVNIYDFIEYLIHTGAPSNESSKLIKNIRDLESYVKESPQPYLPKNAEELEPNLIPSNELKENVENAKNIKMAKQEELSLAFTKEKTIKAVNSYAQSKEFTELSKEKQEAILSLKHITPEPMPQEINIKDFENLRLHFDEKADKAQREAFLKLFEATKNKPDIVLEVLKEGELRQEFIKAFQHKESKDLYYLAILKDEKEITGIPTTQIKKVMNDIARSERILNAESLGGILNPAEPLHKQTSPQLSKPILPQNQNLSKQALETPQELQEQWLKTFDLKSIDEDYIPQFSPEVKEALEKAGIKEDIHLKYGSLVKLEKQNREKYMPYIKPTLENPDLILSHDEALIFVKDIGKESFFTSVSKSLNGELVVKTNSFKTLSTLKNKLEQQGEVLFLNEKASNPLTEAFTAKMFPSELVKESDKKDLIQQSPKPFTEAGNFTPNSNKDILPQKPLENQTNALNQVKSHSKENVDSLNQKIATLENEIKNLEQKKQTLYPRPTKLTNESVEAYFAQMPQEIKEIEEQIDKIRIEKHKTEGIKNEILYKAKNDKNFPLAEAFLQQNPLIQAYTSNQAPRTLAEKYQLVHFYNSMHTAFESLKRFIEDYPEEYIESHIEKGLNDLIKDIKENIMPKDYHKRIYINERELGIDASELARKKVFLECYKAMRATTNPKTPLKPIIERFTKQGLREIKKNEKYINDILKSIHKEEINVKLNEKSLNADELNEIISKWDLSKETNANSKQKIITSQVSDEEAELLKSEFNFKENKPLVREIDSQQIIHTLKNHGDEAIENQRGQEAITLKDISDYQSIIKNADLRVKQDNGRILYAKQVNGSFIVLEEALEGQDKLRFFSMWKQKGKLNKEVLLSHSQRPNTNPSLNLESHMPNNTKPILPQNQNLSKENTLHSNAHIGSGLVSGSIAGISEDEEGNINFNPSHFAAGFMGGVGASKAVSYASKKAKVLERIKQKNEAKSTLTQKRELRSQTKERLNLIKNKDIENKNGIRARISSVGIAKMCSDAAINKSLENGFEVSQHFEAVNNIENLFKQSEFLRSEKPKNQSKDLVAVHRFLTKDALKDKPANALITLKESIQNGNRIYSLELEALSSPISTNKPQPKA